MPRRSTLLQILVSLAAALMVLLPFGALSSSDEPPITWSDTARDVVVDGEAEPGIVVLTSSGDGESRLLAVLSERLDAAYVVDLDTLEVGTLPLSDFAFEGSGATSPAKSRPALVGRATTVRDGRSVHYLLTADQHTLLISPHQGGSGSLTLDELFTTVPTWRQRTQTYTPDPAAVAALAAHDREIEVTVALGTWCGDSRNYVPKLLRTLEDADNPNVRLELVAIQRGFKEPAELIREERLTNVPTVIVREDGREIGRIVETPATATVETDLAAILQGTPETHPGRLQREEEIANGRYAYLDDGDQRLGSETWELYRTENGGTLLHSIVERGDRTVEIWHRRSSDGASEHAELTCREGDELSRTRIWIDEDGALRSVTRSNTAGIVDQSLQVPPGTRLLLPCAATSELAWAEDDGAEADGSTTQSVFQIPWDQPAAGSLVEMTSQALGQELLRREAGEVSVAGVETHLSGNSSRWWLDEELGLPWKVTVDGLGRIEAEHFTRAEAPSDSSVELTDAR